MINLNGEHGNILYDLARKIMNEFDEALVGCEMGIAYAGGIEEIGKIWKGRGIIYGFDTFTGHPKQIAELCEYCKSAGGVNSLAASNMDGWYERYGREGYSYEYIRAELDRQGLDNVILIKGLIDDKTKIFIDKLHYCFFDLDFPLSMWQAYNLVKDKVIGYLCLHDIFPITQMPGNYEYYLKILDEGLFSVYFENRNVNCPVILKRK
jgi:hypothetical protein